MSVNKLEKYRGASGQWAVVPVNIAAGKARAPIELPGAPTAIAFRR